MKLGNEIKSIEGALDKMRAKLNVLETKIENRENFFNDKSEKWQESDKGEAYAEETEELQDKFNDIEFEIDQIESSLEQLKELTE
jgi:chromosome segregation ATPase